MAAGNRLTRLSVLLGAWGAYWLLLVGVKLGPAIAAILRATGPGESGSSVNLSYGDEGFLLSVVQHGQTIYSATTHLLPLTLWIAGPPLGLWIAWSVVRAKRSREERRAAAL